MNSRNIRKQTALAALASAILLVGCHPYYNTLYNGEEAYLIAQRDYKKVKMTFPDSVVLTPSGAMSAQYDRTITKSLKMMEVYPKDKKHQDKAHFLMGCASFYKLDFPVSIGRMRDLQMAYPQSPYAPISQIYVAKAHIMMDNLVLAEEILVGLMKEHPRLDKDQEITMLLVEIALRRGGRTQALGLLENINRSSLPIERRIDIILRIADLTYELRQYDKALALLRTAPRTNKLPYLMYRVDRSIYFCLDAMNSLNIADEHLWAMQRNRRYADHKYEIMYYRAVTVRKMGRLDEAIALFDEIKKQMCEKTIDQADTSSLCGRTFYELALIYQDMGNFDMAEAMFEEATQAKGAPYKEQASARLLAIKKLKELLKPDSLGRISSIARFAIAEIFFFELETPDSAYAYYLRLADDTLDASAFRPRSLMAAALVVRKQKWDAAKADSLLKIVIAENEGTEYARRAQIELNVEVTAITAREKAERDFRIAETMLANDAVGAVKAFYNVYKQYSNTDIAAKSLYAAAWYTDNILQKNRAAMTLYEELCEKYSSTEYCVKMAEPRIAVARDSIRVRSQRREAAKAATAADSLPFDPKADVKEESSDDL